MRFGETWGSSVTLYCSLNTEVPASKQQCLFKAGKSTCGRMLLCLTCAETFNWRKAG